MKVLAAFVYPIKSMRAVEVSALQLDERGIVGDRRWMVVDAQGKFISQRTVPALARLQPSLMSGGVRIDDGANVIAVPWPESGGMRRSVTVWQHQLDALDGGDEVASWLTGRLHVECRLVAFPHDAHRAVNPQYAASAQTTFTDGYPMLWVNEASLDALNESLPAPLPMNRFRPNVVVRDSAAWKEDGWNKLHADGLVYEAVKPCARCAVITVDQTTAEKPQGSAPLSSLVQTHSLPEYGPVFGMNVVPRGVGVLHVGAAVRVEMT